MVLGSEKKSKYIIYFTPNVSFNILFFYIFQIKPIHTLDFLFSHFLIRCQFFLSAPVRAAHPLMIICMSVDVTSEQVFQPIADDLGDQRADIKDYGNVATYQSLQLKCSQKFLTVFGCGFVLFLFFFF